MLDYFTLQGGKPQIAKGEDGLWHIRHEYRADRPEVVTHISPQERGTVVINGVEYEVAFLWRFEGEPCEGRSASEGGGAYKRHGEKER